MRLHSVVGWQGSTWPIQIGCSRVTPAPTGPLPINLIIQHIIRDITVLITFYWLFKTADGCEGSITSEYFHDEQLNIVTDIKPVTCL